MIETPGQGRGLGRRALLRNTLVVGAGAVTLGAISIPLSGAAYAGSYQNYWGWCTKCNEFFWATNEFENAGTCPVNNNDPHTLGGTAYTAMYGFSTSGNPADTSSAGQQAGWAWCTSCSAMFWKSNGGSCPALSIIVEGNVVEKYVAHSPGGTNYAIPFGVGNSDYQDGWNYCVNCSCLYWGGTWGASVGTCLDENANRKHVAGSDTHYQAIFT